MRKKLSPWAHRELTVSTVVTAPGPMITAQSRLGEVTAQSRLGHSSVTARSQLSHCEVTAQSRHLQYDHGSVTARSQLNHGPGHDSVTAGCDHFGHLELTMSSLWAHGEQSRWPIFFSWEVINKVFKLKFMSTCCPLPRLPGAGTPTWPPGESTVDVLRMSGCLCVEELSWFYQNTWDRNRQVYLLCKIQTFNSTGLLITDIPNFSDLAIQ